MGVLVAVTGLLATFVGLALALVAVQGIMLPDSLFRGLLALICFLALACFVALLWMIGTVWNDRRTSLIFNSGWALELHRPANLLKLYGTVEKIRSNWHKYECSISFQHETIALSAIPIKPTMIENRFMCEFNAKKVNVPDSVTEAYAKVRLQLTNRYWYQWTSEMQITRLPRA
ncbi:MAG: hypothetical protein O2854_00070 [Chloroflexi bacterium]|nr:hypothetical protein [Chloroflexota bacterium]